MVMDYYAYWNGGQIRDLFEALVSICSGSSYEGLLKTAVLAGFLVTLTGALLKWQGLASKVYLFAAVLFYSVMLVPKVDVAIHDERSADVYVVSNVPSGKEKAVSKLSVRKWPILEVAEAKKPTPNGTLLTT